jgi:hypothetical protein
MRLSGTLGWIADAFGLALCGGYRGLVGSMPPMCAVNGGRPMLGIVCVILFGAFLAFVAWRALKA